MNKNRAFALVGAILFLLLFEGMVRCAFMVPAMQEDILSEDNISWRHRWKARRDSLGTRITYGFDRYDATKGWFSRPNIRGLDVFDNKLLNTNSYGLRGRQEFAPGETPGTPRVFVLGDSFTFGDEVGDDEVYVELLRGLFPDVEFMNLGIHGYGHDQMLILFREMAPVFKPDVVVLGFMGTDMQRNLLSFRDYAKPKFILKNGELRLTGVPVPTVREVERFDWLRPRLFDLVYLLRHQIEVKTGRRQRNKEQITLALLDALQREARANGIEPVYVYLPVGSEIYSEARYSPEEEYFNRYCAAHPRLKCVSLTDEFRRRRARGERFKQAGHWSKAGHVTAAEALAAYLAEQNLLPHQLSTH